MVSNFKTRINLTGCSSDFQTLNSVRIKWMLDLQNPFHTLLALEASQKLLLTAVHVGLCGAVTSISAGGWWDAQCIGLGRD